MPDPQEEKPILYMTHECCTLPIEEAGNIAIEAYFSVCAYEHIVKQASNVEFMSPNGLVPVLVLPGDHNHVVSGCFPIIKHIKHTITTFGKKEKDLPITLRVAEKIQLLKVDWILDILKNVIIYYTWFEKKESYANARGRYAGKFSWIIGNVMTFMKYREATAYFQAIGWHEKCREEVLFDLRSACEEIERLLSNGKFLFKQEKPNDKDVLIFGHLMVLKIYFNIEMLSSFSWISMYLKNFSEGKKIEFDPQNVILSIKSSAKLQSRFTESGSGCIERTESFKYWKRSYIIPI